MIEAIAQRQPNVEDFFRQKNWEYTYLPLQVDTTSVRCVLPTTELKNGDFYAQAFHDTMSANKVFFGKSPPTVDIAIVDSTIDYNYFHPGRKTKGDYRTGTAMQKKPHLTILTPESLLTESTFVSHSDPSYAGKSFRFTLAHELNHIYVLHLAANRKNDLPMWLVEGMTFMVTDSAFDFPRKYPRTFSDADMYLELSRQNRFPDSHWLKYTHLGSGNESPIIYNFSRNFTIWFASHYATDGRTFPDFLEKFGTTTDESFLLFFEHYFGVNIDEVYGQFMTEMMSKKVT